MFLCVSIYFICKVGQDGKSSAPLICALSALERLLVSSRCMPMERGFGTKWSLRFLSTQKILWSYEIKKIHRKWRISMSVFNCRGKAWAYGFIAHYYYQKWLSFIHSGSGQCFVKRSYSPSLLVCFCLLALIKKSMGQDRVTSLGPRLFLCIYGSCSYVLIGSQNADSGQSHRLSSTPLFFHQKGFFTP